jgi:hypothetical protein
MAEGRGDKGFYGHKKSRFFGEKSEEIKRLKGQKNTGIHGFLYFFFLDFFKKNALFFLEKCCKISLFLAFFVRPLRGILWRGDGLNDGC